jgi:hypothetical protein
MAHSAERDEYENGSSLFMVNSQESNVAPLAYNSP